MDFALITPYSIQPVENTDAAANEKMRAEFMGIISENIGKLPLHQRQVVTMRYFESRSLEEISLLLDIREATVRTLLRHGVNNLRRHFKRSYLVPEE